MTDNKQDSETAATGAQKTSASKKLFTRGVLTLAFGMVGLGVVAGFDRGNTNEWLACEAPQAQKAPCSPAKMNGIEEEDALLSVAALLSTLLAAKGVLTLAPLNNRKRGATGAARQP